MSTGTPTAASAICRLRVIGQSFSMFPPPPSTPPKPSCRPYRFSLPSPIRMPPRTQNKSPHRLPPAGLRGQLPPLRPCDGLDVRGETFLQPMMIFSPLRECEMHHLVGHDPVACECSGSDGRSQGDADQGPAVVSISGAREH